MLSVPRPAMLVAALAVLVALVVSPCAAAGTPTRTSWAAAANGICSAGNAQIRRLPAGTSPAVRASNYRVMAGISKREHAKLAVLPRPVSELPNITFFLSKARALVTLYDQAARAAAKNDKPALARVLATIRNVRSPYDFAARVLGAQACARTS